MQFQSHLLIVIFAIPSALVGQRSLTDIPEPDPEAELADFVVADGFEVNLFASDPMIRKPIQISFDAEGRLWVASSAIYPQISPGQPESDQIVVLEDTDSDGTADKSTVFAEGFLIPTGILPGDGGVYVADSTDMVFLKDTDGDGRADSEEVVLSGFGTEDTHHIIHAFTWGPSGAMFFNQSIYIHSHVETPWGVRRLNAGGIWRFEREALKLEVFSRGMINPWGHVFDDWGNSFATDGAYSEGINYVFPGAQYATAVGATRILSGLNRGEPKHSGLARVTGSHFPDDWQGNLLANDFRANRVNRFAISEAGSGFASVKKDDLLRSRRVTFRPVAIQQGPDGAIYIADWYNPIIQHGEVDFRDGRRDKGHGRIWRVTAKGSALAEKPEINGATVDGLLGLLGAPEQWTRDQARLRLQRMEAGQELVAKVKAFGAAGDTRAALQSLWILQGLGRLDRDLLDRCLSSCDHRLRAAAVRSIFDGYAAPDDCMPALAKAAGDEHPQVQLEAVRALGRIPSLEAASAAMRALDGQAPDRFLDYALWLTARELAPVWLPAVRGAGFDFGGNPAHLIYALKAVNGPEVAGPLAMVVADGSITFSERASAADFLANIGGQPEIDFLFLTARKQWEGGAEAQFQSRLLQALVKAAKERKLIPSADRGDIGAMISSAPIETRRSAVQLAGIWGVTDVADRVIALAGDEGAEKSLRLAAIEALAGIGGKKSKALLGSIWSGGGDFRLDAFRALARLDVGSAADVGVAAMDELNDPSEVKEIFGSLLDQGGAAALVKALDGATLDREVAELGIQSLALTGVEHPGLETALRGAGRLSANITAFEPQELREFIEEVSKIGDPVRGETVYRRPQLLCIQCHAIGGAGGRVGPDLISIGASAPVDYLVESLLAPNAKVKEGYHLTTVTTAEGGVFVGTGARETDTHLVLIDAANRDREIPLDQIASSKIGKSLMPAGLTAPLSRSEFVDLVRFLHDLGRTPELSIAGGNQAIRDWSVVSKKTGERVPVTARVSGGLSAVDLASAVGKQGSYELYYSLEVAAPGDITFQFDSLDGLNRLDFAGTTLSPSTEITVGVPAGRHQGMVRLIPSQREAPLKVSIIAKEGSGGAKGVQVVTPALE